MLAGTLRRAVKYNSVFGTVKGVSKKKKKKKTSFFREFISLFREKKMNENSEVAKHKIILLVLVYTAVI